MSRFLSLLLVVFALNACDGGRELGAATDGEGQPPVATGPVVASLKILSNRPDLVSGGDVLVEVLVESSEDLSRLRLTRNGEDVTRVLQPSAPELIALLAEADEENPFDALLTLAQDAFSGSVRLLGRVAGLALGDNTLALNIGNSVVVTNHPVGGPVFTGPQIQPWLCRNDAAADAQCNQPVEYRWLYKSSDPTSAGLQPYDPDSPPGDVASTTTDTGQTVPFIVLEETGYQARDQYIILTLQEPGQQWTPARPEARWNRRLLVTHGGNCRGHHQTSNPRLDDYAGTIPPNPAIEQSYMTALGKGWAVLSTAQLNLGHNCNLSYQAESLMMAKERFVEQYGELKYTVGTGCSGGAITQNMLANAYPGLYQGLLTTCTYPDVISTATQFADYHILLRYFGTNVDNPTNTTARDGTVFTVQQQNQIYGHEGGVVNASLADSGLFSDAVNPQSNCGGVSDEQRYHPENNPTGTRCDVLTFMQNMVGPREQFDAYGNLRWSAIEQALGYGFAGIPLGNQGVQYGLRQLQQGVITPDQFLALNVNIGAIDHDLNIIPARLSPDYPALPNAYRTGMLNTIVNMDTVAIINMTGPDPGAAHDSVHGYWVRWRLEREFGHRDNFVHWGGATALIGDANYMNESLLAMQDWLDAVAADTSDRPLAEKIVANKPASVQDQCNGVPGAMCPEQAMLVFGTPRTEAGADQFGDHVQCQLRPFSRDDDYGLGNLVWTEEQWQQLEAAFMVNGEPMVCDWSKRPLEWQATIPWLGYQDRLGNLITGGRQMSPAPFPPGWAAAAFEKAWEPAWESRSP